MKKIIRIKWHRNNSRLILFCMLLLSSFVQMQASGLQAPISVSGTVKDSDGETLIGVSVALKNDKTLLCLSDADGKFSIPSIAPNAVLLFSYMGMKNKEVAVNGHSTINVTMQYDNVALSEMVVIGYGAVKKSDLTGSVSSIRTDAIKNIPANSIDGMLQGRAAGLQIVNASQDPGASSTVRIRGGSSLRGSNAPLLVVDGFPFGEAGNLKQINPDDIVSVEVLKDASASAIYGSRGANGVILITTNKAKAGKMKVNLKHQTTLSEFSSQLMRWKDGTLMAQLNNEDRVNAGLAPLYIGAVNSNGIYYPSVSEIQSGAWPHFTRWDKIVFRDTPLTNNTSASINSASDKTSFNLSLNYFDEQGVYIKDDYDKWIVRLAVDHELFKNFTLRTSNSFSKNNRNSNGGLAYYRNPLWPVYNDDGSYFLSGKNDYGHPVAITDKVLNKSKGLDYISSWMVDYQALDWLTIKAQINYKYGNSKSNSYNPTIYTSDGDFNNGAAYMGEWSGENFSSENYITIDKTFGDIHRINGMVGHSYEESLTRNISLASYDFVNEALGNENMGAGNPEKNVHGNSQVKTKLLSYMGRINYTLNNKYLFTATMRTDGSSKFGANNKWAYFPSGAISWKAHEESFVKTMNVFDELKVRFSYGISGNQGISAYQTLSRYGIEKYYDSGKWNTTIGPGYVVGYEGDNYRFRVWGGIPNVDLKWETTAQTDFGIDMAFFNRRLRVVADVYYKETSDLLRESLLPLSSGYNRIWINDGKISNKGFELSIDGDIISTRDFNLSANLIYSMNRNKVLGLGDDVRSGLNTDYITGMKYEFIGSSLSSFSQSPNILAIGKPVNVFYGYKVGGIIQTEAEGLAQGLSGTLAQPGEFKYLDLSGDGNFTPDDRTIIGDPNPDFMASLSLNGSYKNFDFEIFLNGVFGNDVLYQNKWGGQASTMPLRWTQDNRNNAYPSLRQDRTYYLSDWYVEDGSFVRIQNISIGYNYKPKAISWLSNVRISMAVSNLHTFSKFDGYDPEVGTNGIYWGGYPRFRKWVFGLAFTF